MAVYTEEVAMKFHPRAFAAFGSDLVTNDCVAIAELVKNSYDAFAIRVSVNIELDKISIADDGCGMTAEIIRDAWAVIATPHKQRKPFIEKNGKVRRVSGNKGLGRFSAARLGRYLKIVTKSVNSEVITAVIDWKNFSDSEEMRDCKFKISVGEENSHHIEKSGTYIEITNLYSIWDDKKIEELKNSLSRLLSPFDATEDFAITLNYDGNLFDRATFSIKPQEFIKKPTYSIKGEVSATGDIAWKYQYLPKAIKKNEKSGTVLWEDSCKGFDGEYLLGSGANQSYVAGKFSFEIRAWDLDSQSIGDVAETFDLKKREIRSTIAQYKGLSVYRDNVLVLPKSDTSKDWLGIDLRRVSHIGRRLGTSQIIGMINITAENNPRIKDTTDREKLVDTIEYKQFCKIIETILVTLENLRFLDKTPEKKAGSMSDLISPLTSAGLVQKVEEDVKSGKTKEEILETVQEYAANNEKILGELNERLIYYAQTASLGSVAIVILHEILTGMTVIKRFLSRITKQFKDIDTKTKEYLTDAETWHLRLVDVANSFAPLYRKNLRKESHPCIVNEEINKSIRLISSKKAAKDVEFIISQSEQLKTKIFAGELQTILVNLFDNALYWINYSQKNAKKILVTVKKESGKIRVTVSDTGTGIDQKDVEKIFMPGVTGKPHGIGMGLVIVTELLHNYDCKIGTVLPSELGGATFIFELPLVEEEIQ